MKTKDWNRKVSIIRIESEYRAVEKKYLQRKHRSSDDSLDSDASLSSEDDEIDID